MIFVDTSIWISYFRGADLSLIAKLNTLLDEDRVALAAPVWLELLSGVKNSESGMLRRVLSALPRYYPVLDTWKKLDDWIGEGLKKGQRFGSMDLLIACIVKQEEGHLWSLDADFARMAKLRFVELYTRRRMR